MKISTLLFSILVIGVSALPAHANDKQIADDLQQQAVAVSEDMTQQVIDAFCQRAAATPQPKNGEIVVYYERNDRGECVAKFISATQEQ